MICFKSGYEDAERINVVNVGESSKDKRTLSKSSKVSCFTTNIFNFTNNFFKVHATKGSE